MPETNIKLPRGQRLIKQDETIGGRMIAMSQVSANLFAIMDVDHRGFTDNASFAGHEVIANGIFEARLMEAA